MKTMETNLLDWQKRYGTEEACAQALAHREPDAAQDTHCHGASRQPLSAARSDRD